MAAQVAETVATRAAEAALAAAKESLHRLLFKEISSCRSVRVLDRWLKDIKQLSKGEVGTSVRVLRKRKKLSLALKNLNSQKKPKGLTKRENARERLTVQQKGNLLASFSGALASLFNLFWSNDTRLKVIGWNFTHMYELHQGFDIMVFRSADDICSSTTSIHQNRRALDRIRAMHNLQLIDEVSASIPLLDIKSNEAFTSSFGFQ
ncbi:unnamed protein product [Victoria cruziana]